jgi:hypothetical protein
VNAESTQSDLEAVAAALVRSWSDRGSTAFRAALSRLEALANSGLVRACEALAEILALEGPTRDAAAAYRWYYIALSQQGYSVRFEDQNLIPPHYCGPVGDFRNEAQVSALVDELGFERVHELDREAQAWLDARHLTTGCSGP